MLDKNLEFHPVVSHPGSKDTSEVRGRGSERLQLRGAQPAQDLGVGIQWCVWLGREQALEPCAPPKPGPVGKRGVG